MKKIRKISLLASIIFCSSIAFAQLPILNPDALMQFYNWNNFNNNYNWNNFNNNYNWNNFNNNYNNTVVTPTPAPSSQPTSTSSSSASQRVERKCSRCNGTGTVIEHGTGFGNTKWCNQCGKEVRDSHYHATCPSCKGSGKW